MWRALARASLGWCLHNFIYGIHCPFLLASVPLCDITHSPETRHHKQDQPGIIDKVAQKGSLDLGGKIDTISIQRGPTHFVRRDSIFGAPLQHP